MLREFQEIFVDPVDHSPLVFEGELRNERWYNGQLCSAGGRIWTVRNGVPDFVQGVESGLTEEVIRRNEERVKKLLSDGTYERNWNRGKRILTEQGSVFAEACQKIIERGSPIIDVGSGPGGGFMPSLLALDPECIVMATDILAPIVHGWNEFFDSNEISLPVCLAALDARKMPFASESVKVITSNVGFSSVDNSLLAFREAARVLANDGIIYAGEGRIEPEGLKTLSLKMGWDFEERFGRRYKMSFHEMFDKCGLTVLKEQHYYRRKMRPDDNEDARTACEVGVELWVGGNLYWLTKN